MLNWLEKSVFVIAACGVSLILAFLILPTPEPSLQSALSVSHQAIDFGQISAYQEAATSFKLTNTSGHDLEFRFGVDCSCTGVNPLFGQLRAGESREVRVDYRPVGSSDGRSNSIQSTQIDLQVAGYGCRIIPITAQVVRPLLFASGSFKRKIAVLKREPFEIDLSLQDDVKAIRILSAPEFLRDLQLSDIHPTFRAVKLAGMLDGVRSFGDQGNSLVFEVTLGRGEVDHLSPIVFDVPFDLTLANPFSLQPRVLSFTNSDAQTVSLHPQQHVTDLELVSAVSTLLGVRVEQASATSCIVQRESNETPSEWVGSTGYLQLTIMAASNDHEPQTFSVNIPVFN